MKNYSMPIIAVISALIFVGIAVGISVGMKHIPEVEYVNSSNGKFRTDEKEFGDAEIKEVKVNMEYGRLEFEYGDKLEVISRFSDEEMPSVTLENGVLNITQSIPKKTFSVRINTTEDSFKSKVIVPKGTVLSNMDIILDDGDVKVTDVQGENMIFTLKEGDIDMNGATFTSFRADISNYGDVTINTPEEVDQNKITVNTNHGDVTVNGQKL